jgi:hypothetical protein
MSAFQGGLETVQLGANRAQLREDSLNVHPLVPLLLDGLLDLRSQEPLSRRPAKTATRTKPTRMFCSSR